MALRQISLTLVGSGFISRRPMNVFVFVFLMGGGGAIRAERDNAAYDEDVRSLVSDEGQTSATKANVSVVIENDTPYKIKEVVVLHKYLGVDPPTQVLAWGSLEPSETSRPQNVTTKVGWNALRQDWWMVSFRLEKHSDRGCVCCHKEDGECETWLTDPKNAVGQFFTDPMTYVKAATSAVNIIAAAVTAGASTAATLALSGMVTESVAGSYFAEKSTDGFKACGLNEKDLKNSRAGRPVRIRISPVLEHNEDVWTPASEGLLHDKIGHVGEVEDGTRDHVVKLHYGQMQQSDAPHEIAFAPRTGDIVRLISRAGDSPNLPPIGTRGAVLGRTSDGLLNVTWNGSAARGLAHVRDVQMVQAAREESVPAFNVAFQMFEEGTTAKDPPLSAVRWECNTHAKSMPCALAPGENDAGEDVPIEFIDRSGRNVKLLTIIHKFNGLSPPVHIFEWNASTCAPKSDGSATNIGIARTETGFGFRNDWWTFGWVEEEDDCMAQSTFEGDFLTHMRNHPEGFLAGAALSVTSHVLDIPAVWNSAQSVGSHYYAHHAEMTKAGNAMTGVTMRIFGAPLLKKLTAGDDTVGFMKCNLSPRDVENGKNGRAVQVILEPDGVRMLADGGASDCFIAKAELRCLEKPGCAARESCRSLASSD